MLRATQAFHPAYAPPRTAVSRNSLRTRCLLRRGGPTSPLRAASAAVPRVAASLRAGSLAASALTTAPATAGSTSLFTFSTAGSTFGPAQSRAVVTLGAAQSTAVSTLGAAQSTAVSTLGAAQSRVASATGRRVAAQRRRRDGLAARLFARRAVERDFFCRVVMGDTGTSGRAISAWLLPSVLRAKRLVQPGTRLADVRSRRACEDGRPLQGRPAPAPFEEGPPWPRSSTPP